LAIGAEKNGEPAANGKSVVAEAGVVFSRDAATNKVATEFIKAIAQHRHWGRELNDQVPA
jgi:hypothetical protein